MEPFRETFWNIPLWSQWLLYTAFIAAGLLFVFGVYRRVGMWRRGKRETRFDHLGKRAKNVLAYAFGHSRTAEYLYPGLMHLAVFWGFVALLIGTLLIFVEESVTLRFFSLKFLKGGFYLFYETTLDTLGLLFIVGLALAAYRRYVGKPRSLDTIWDDTAILSLLAAIGVTGFLVEGLRLAFNPTQWGHWSSVGFLIAEAVVSSGLGEASGRSLHLALWLLHAALSLAVIAVTPYTKLFHLVTDPLNIFFGSMEPPGALRPVANIEEAERVGASGIRDFTWKQMLDFDSCTHCGRCEDACPAYEADTPLNPKAIILKLQKHMVQAYKEEEALLPPLHGGVISPEELWACTTCRACVEECPVLIEHVDEIVDMRRYLVVSEGKIPASLSTCLRSLTSAQNPWGLAREDRVRWAEGLDVRVLREGDEVDVLYWVGCSASYDVRNQSVARSMVRLMKAAGVDFAVLGNSERCTGDPARRIGEEYLYQLMAKENIEALNKYRFKRMVTACPHCFNTLKNEYPQLGGRFPVVHHAQFIAELLESGRLKPSKELNATIAFHDPCYLGRYNDIFDAPREILSSARGVKLVEARRTRDRSFCCGGGGGSMWMEIKGEKRVNTIRLEELSELRPHIVATACPYCTSMLEAAARVRGEEQSPRIREIAELLDEAVLHK